MSGRFLGDAGPLLRIPGGVYGQIQGLSIQLVAQFRANAEGLIGVTVTNCQVRPNGLLSPLQHQFVSYLSDPTALLPLQHQPGRTVGTFPENFRGIKHTKMYYFRTKYFQTNPPVTVYHQRSDPPTDPRPSVRFAARDCGAQLAPALSATRLHPADGTLRRTRKRHRSDREVRYFAHFVTKLVRYFALTCGAMGL